MRAPQVPMARRVRRELNWECGLGYKHSGTRGPSPSLSQRCLGNRQGRRGRSGQTGQVWAGCFFVRGLSLGEPLSRAGTADRAGRAPDLSSVHTPHSDFSLRYTPDHFVFNTCVCRSACLFIVFCFVFFILGPPGKLSRSSAFFFVFGDSRSESDRGRFEFGPRADLLA